VCYESGLPQPHLYLVESGDRLYVGYANASIPTGIVYLALHRHGVDSEQLWEALWPNKPINRGTLHTTVTAARTGLGRTPDGSRYLPNAGDGLYRLGPAVSLDWDRFRALVHAGQAGGPDAADLLHQALELIRGRPLDSPASRSYEWAVVHRTEMETVIAETAELDLCRLARATVSR
jgi:DNA-binding SARP family transcriptional activator